MLLGCLSGCVSYLPLLQGGLLQISYPYASIPDEDHLMLSKLPP